jgi:hypothetical protein
MIDKNIKCDFCNKYGSGIELKDTDFVKNNTIKLRIKKGDDKYVILSCTLNIEKENTKLHNDKNEVLNDILNLYTPISDISDDNVPNIENMNDIANLIQYQTKLFKNMENRMNQKVHICKKCYAGLLPLIIKYYSFDKIETF